MTGYTIPLDKPAERRLMLATRSETLDELNRYFEPDSDSPAAMDPPKAQYAKAGTYKGRLLMPAEWLLTMNEGGLRNVNPMWVMAAKEPALILTGSDGEYAEEISSAKLIEERERQRKEDRAQTVYLRHYGMI